MQDIFTNCYNMYDNLESTQKKDFRVRNYTTMIVSFLCQMFKINGLSDLQKNTLLTYVLTNGTCLIDTRNDKIELAAGHYYGVPEYGEILPPTYLATKPHGKTVYRFNDNPATVDGVAVAYINHFLAPCTEIFKFASDLSDCATSLHNNVMFCRIAPIGAVQDDKTKKTYENACEKMLNGELVNSVHVPFNVNSDAPSTLATIDISNGDYANKIQYLSMYHEQLLSRLCKLFGIPYNVFSKSANITTEELGNIDIFSSILPTSMKTCLSESLEKIGFTVEFTDSWKWIDDIKERNQITTDDELKQDDETTYEPTDENKGGETE